MLCIDACPYGALFENEELSIAQKCSGCAHLLDDGWEEPRCVDACPHGSLGFMEEHEAQQRYGRDFEEALQNHGERLIILNKPKTFVAGTTVDLVADEVVIGARITLENKEDGALLTQTSDEFGDFWFKQVDPCDYRIYIERDGYLNQSRELSTKEADCNVGIIEMASASFFEGISEELHIEEDEIMDAPRDEINLDLSSGNDYYKFKKGT
jgi:NAD-dependent dihydropyrimidine dehydrogenase PreA subunit